MRSRSSTGLAIAGVSLALLASGCGGASGERDEEAGAAVRAFLTAIADGDTETACRLLTTAGAAELAYEFEEPTCEGAATQASEFVADNRNGPRAYRDARTLVRPYLPLPPPPVSESRPTAAIRVVYVDPVIGQRQAVDVVVRRSDRGWRVDGNLAPLFTRFERPLDEALRPTEPRRERRSRRDDSRRRSD